MIKYFIILLGSITWVATMWQSGQQYDYGIGFWGPHGHDAVWHISLINSLTQGTLSLPMFAGESLKNYHFGFDVMTALLVKLTGISASVYYFQILPIIFSLTIGFLVYYLTRNIWSTYLTYFATGMGWIIGKGESTFWAQQAISTLINPPYALSLIFLLLGFIYLKKKNYLLTSIFLGTVGFIKIYAGMLGLFTLFFFSFPWFLVACGLSIVLFLPFNSLSTSTLIFEPLWFVQNLFSDPDRFYSSRMFNYLHSTNYLKLIPAYVFAILIFFLGNLGVRVFGLLKIRSHFLPLIILGLLFPLFFVQSGTTWNTIQFMYYSLFFLGLFIKPKNIIFVICILVLTLPAIPATLRHYLPERPPATIPTSEVQALNFLRTLPAGIVLVPLFDKNNFSKFTEPRPLFAYESTAYVSAYTGHPVFLEDEVNLKILNIDIQNRRQIVSEIFTSNKQPPENIQYIYIPDVTKINPSFNPSLLGFTQIYSFGPTQLWSKN